MDNFLHAKQKASRKEFEFWPKWEKGLRNCETLLEEEESFLLGWGYVSSDEGSKIG